MGALVVTCQHCRAGEGFDRGYPRDGVPLAEAIRFHLLEYDDAKVSEFLILVGRSGYEALRELGMVEDEYELMPVKLDWSLNEHVQILPAKVEDRGRCPDGELPITCDDPPDDERGGPYRPA